MVNSQYNLLPPYEVVNNVRVVSAGRLADIPGCYTKDGRYLIANPQVFIYRSCVPNDVLTERTLAGNGLDRRGVDVFSGRSCQCTVTVLPRRSSFFFCLTVYPDRANVRSAEESGVPWEFTM